MKQSQKTRIAVLGTGFGREHARIYTSFQDVEVAGIFGRNEQKTGEVAASLGIPAYTDINALMTDHDIDAVDICLPSALHSQYAVAALQQKKHVFVETPAAFSLSEAFAMRDAAKEKNKLCMAALYGRFVPDYQQVHKLMEEGRLGRLLTVFANRRTAPVWGEWDENFIINLMLHDIDAVSWLLGKPFAVSSRALKNPSGGWNYVTITLEYENALAVIEGCGVMPSSFPFSTSLRVVGEKSSVDLNWYWAGTKPESTISFFPEQGEPQILSTPDHDPYEAECRYFIDCVQGKADPALLSMSAACDSLEIALCAKTSLEQSGSRILLKKV